jgi:hypothetical protein
MNAGASLTGLGKWSNLDIWAVVYKASVGGAH